MTPFSCVVAGRQLQNIDKLDDTKFGVVLENVMEINHIVVMLNGTEPFPEGFGGVIHLQFPPSSSQPEPQWIVLGILTNSKPSAIFKLGGKPIHSTLGIMGGFNHAPYSIGEQNNHGRLGISVEPLDQVFIQDERLKGNKSNNNNVTTTTVSINNNKIISVINILDGLVPFCLSFEAFGRNVDQTIKILKESVDKAKYKTKSLLDNIS